MAEFDPHEEFSFERDRAFRELVDPDRDFKWDEGVAVFPLRRLSPGLLANRAYMDRAEWQSNYLAHVHRSPEFRSRWSRVAGSWDDEIVVDIGCGPGNVGASLGKRAKALIGIDVSLGALKTARKFGYLPVLADAQDLPLKSRCADIVIVNATLHHCDDMALALSEAARLTAPGGLLVTDHDPQLSAWAFRGAGLAIWRSRIHIYRALKKGFHRSLEEQSIALQSEIHHDAGDGVSADFFRSVLEPLGFDVEIYPHNHDLGAEVLDGDFGRAKLKFRVAQRLSRIDPRSPAAALSLMCKARRRAACPAVSRQSGSQVPNRR